MAEEEKIVEIVYTNYRGETGTRRIVPKRLWFGSTEWHPKPQWLLDAHDLEKEADRSFAMRDVRCWLSAPQSHAGK